MFAHKSIISKKTPCYFLSHSSMKVPQPQQLSTSAAHRRITKLPFIHELPQPSLLSHQPVPKLPPPQKQQLSPCNLHQQFGPSRTSSQRPSSQDSFPNSTPVQIERNLNSGGEGAGYHTRSSRESNGVDSEPELRFFGKSSCEGMRSGRGFRRVRMGKGRGEGCVD